MFCLSNQGYLCSWTSQILWKFGSHEKQQSQLAIFQKQDLLTILSNQWPLFKSFRWWQKFKITMKPIDWLACIAMIEFSNIYDALLNLLNDFKCTWTIHAGMVCFISFQNIPAMVSLAFMWYMIHSGMIHPPLSSPTPVRGPSANNNVTGRLPETIATQRCQI